MQRKRISRAADFNAVWPVLVRAVGVPGEAARRHLETQYLLTDGFELWGLREGGQWVGVIGARIAQPGEITHIAVDAAWARRGLGRTLWCELLTRHPDVTDWIAETDDDAVGFYMRLGFTIEPLPPRYPGVTRYRCTYRIP
jgi:ribosomal protein S18 acetylase RimI-like enzyme